MNEKLKVILKKNAEYEQQTPYNFCDRWCERCNPETQRRCQLYLDELGLQLTNIAHGRDPEDIEIFEEDLDMLTPDVDILEDSWLDDDELEDEFDDDETLQTIERQRRELSTHPLMKVVKQYQLLTSRFLNKNYFDKIYPEGKIPYNFETISWYHTLLPIKMQRALSDIISCDPFDPDEYLLCDAVAQLGICKKSIILSIEAFRRIIDIQIIPLQETTQLLALLHNIASQIKILEDSI